MNLFWIGAGCLLGIFNTCTQWWIVQRINPYHGSASPVRLALSSSVIRMILTGVIFLIAFQQNLQYGISLITSLVITKWLSLIYFNRK